MAIHKKDFIIREILVTDPSKHENGFTIYKVVYKYFSKESPEKITQIMVWKRYNDFKKLYQSLTSLHHNLRRPEKFPEFAKPTYFGRFDEKVIEERRSNAQTLLNFSTTIPPLVKSQIFNNFFEGGEKTEHDSEQKLLPPPSIQPTPTTPSSLVENSNSSGSEATSQTRENTETSEKESSHLGGVWNYRQDNDDNAGSSGSSASSLIDENPLLLQSSSLPQTQDISIFDPYATDASSNPDVQSSLPHSSSKSCLLQSKDVHTENECMQSERNFLDTLGVEIIEQLKSDEIGGKKCEVLEIPNENSKIHLAANLADGADSKEGGEYIYEAAKDISLALQYETTGHFDLALRYYKAGVNILLNGVVADDNKTRQEAVRRKTAQYLIKAEEIYDTFLSYHPDNKYEWKPEDVSLMDHDPSLSHLRKPNECLGYFKVLGVIDKVILVLDMKTFATYIIKVLKKCSLKNPKTQNLVTNCAYMVKILNYFETSNAIYLLLEYATGGKLWNYASRFLHEEDVDDVFTNSLERSLTASKGLKHGSSHSSSIPRSKISLESKNNKHNSSAEDNVFPQETESSSVNLVSVKKPNDNPISSTTVDKANTKDEIDAAPLSYCASSYVDLFQDYSKSLGEDRTEFSVGIARLKKREEKKHPFDDPLEQHKQDNLLLSDNIAGCVGTNLKGEEVANIKSFTVENSEIENSVSDESRKDVKESELNKLVIQALTYNDDDDASGFQGRPDVLPPLENELLDYPDITHKTELTTSVLEEIEINDSTSLMPKDQTKKPKRKDTTSTSGDLLMMKNRTRSLSSLFSQLDKNCKQAKFATLPESCVTRWAAEIVVALSKLHEHGIICRDLRPDNILLADRGHVKLTFFSEWKLVEPTLSQYAEDHLYMAPEVQSVFESSPACDWWSLGAIIYELLIGKSLYSMHPNGITSHTFLHLPDHVSSEASSLLGQLLQVNPGERLGSGLSGVEEIKNHPFFHSIDWEVMLSTDNNL